MIGSAVNERGSRARPSVWAPENAWLVFGVALALWALRLLHQRACNTGDEKLNTMLRLCYSDQPVLWRAGLGSGQSPFAGGGVDLPPLISVWISITQKLTLALAPISPPGPYGVVGRETFFVGLNTVALGAVFLVLVASHLGLSHLHRGGRELAPIGLLTASSVAVFTAGTISWSLIPAALVAVALLMWSRRQVVAAGVVLGLACSAAWYPFLVIAGLWMLCWRVAMVREWGRMVLTAAATWLVVNVPAVLISPDGWVQQAKATLVAPIGLGSLWYLFQQLTGQNPRAWVVSAVLMAMVLVATAALCWLAPRRPRVAQVMALLVLASTLVAPVYSPQHVIWLAPLVLLARPVRFDWLIFSVAEALYWAAVWGHLQGNLWAGQKIGLYAAAIFLRVAVQGWLVISIVRDIWQPWTDPVRTGHIDDPLGGILDHAPDRAPADAHDDSGLAVVS